MAIIGVCLLLAKAGCESLQQKLQAAKLKKRKGKRKRQNEEDGMGFIEQAVESGDEDDEDGSDSPIEMTLVNRKDGGKPRSKGKGKGKKRNKGSDSGSSEPSEKELKLFEDGDEEDRQPQN